MRRNHSVRYATAAFVAMAWGALVSSSALACDLFALADYAPARMVTSAQTLREVALQSGNALHGSVVDDDGMPQANYEVWIAAEQGRAIKTRTDASGRFTVAGLSPGIYTIDTPCGGGKFRLWEGKDAPRDAQTNVLLVVCAKAAG